MARSWSSYIPLASATRGLASTAPLGGVFRAVWGRTGQEWEAPAAAETPLSTSATDSNGTQRLIDDNIQALDFWSADEDIFANPDKEYTGYAADGYWYTSGELDPTHVPFKASWAEEGEGEGTSVRGTRDGFPARVLVVATTLEVAILDADTLDLWMRFTIAVSTPPGYGPLAGDAVTRIRGVRYVNGYLFLATNTGLRVADFRADRGLVFTSSGVGLSSSSYSTFDGPLSLRNSDTFLDGVFAAETAMLVSEDCLALDANMVSGGRESLNQGTDISARRPLTVVAVGHPGGLSAVTFGWSPDDPCEPRVTQSAFYGIVGSGWDATDDADLDFTTPLFSDDAYAATNWESMGVQPGDTLLTDTSSHTIVEVRQLTYGRSLVVTPELAVGSSGASYEITRSITAVLLTRDLDLYLANGSGSIIVNRAKDWFVVSDAISGTSMFYDMQYYGDMARLSPVPGRINGLAKRGELVLIATDLGVFTVTDAQLSALTGVGEGPTSSVHNALLTYATQAQTTYSAAFHILEGDYTDAKAVVVDPETGNISVAVTGVGGSVVTEVNPNIQRAFRFFNDVGLVRALVAYRNPMGPPDSPEVA